jgi:hypothetical protein
VKERVDPDLYARLIQPRPRADVEAALRAFDEELYALRTKHGIPDLLVVHTTVIDGAGPQVGSMYYGNTGLALQVAAVGLSIWRQRAHRDVERTVDEMLGAKPKRKRAKKEPSK